MKFSHLNYTGSLRSRIGIFMFAVGIVMAGGTSGTQAQEESRPGFGLSRLFRFGGLRGETARPSGSDHKHDHDQDDHETETLAKSNTERVTSPGSRVISEAPAPFAPAVTSPGFGENTNARIAARPRHAGPLTEADPILTRVGIGRSDSGSSFALFVQIYADGTVIDSEGVHHLPVSMIKQVLAVIRGHDFSKIRGHCGQPSADFIENVQMVVYDRSMGRLRAHAFSYPGSPEGCDTSVVHLHKAVDDLIMQMANQKGGGQVTSTTTTTLGSGGNFTGTGGSVNVVNRNFGNGSGGDSLQGLGSTIIEQPESIAVNPKPATIPSYTDQPVQGSVVPRLPQTSTPAIAAPASLPNLEAPK